MKQGYLNEMMKFQSKIDSTNKHFSKIRTVVESYVNERMNEDKK